MKLLTKPGADPKTVEIKIPARRETKFNPLGLLGIGPITTTRDIPARTVKTMPALVRPKPIEIDFEDEDAIDSCIDVGAYDMIKKKTAFPLTFEGDVYVLHGVIPMKLLRDNVWQCSIDFFECEICERSKTV
jgi:hypothetical protein